MQTLQPKVSSTVRFYPTHLSSARIRVVNPAQYSHQPTAPKVASRVSPGFSQDTKQLQLEYLLGEAARGQHQAFSRVYDLTLARVTSVVNAIIFNPSDQDEVIGDVYLQIWKMSTDYRSSRGSVMGWITVIARSRALDFLRKQTRLIKNESLLSQLEIPPQAEANEPLQIQEQLQYSVAIDNLIEQLPSTQKTIISLVYFNGLSQSEIATLMGLPLGTVKSHVRRTLRKLRDQLEN